MRHVLLHAVIPLTLSLALAACGGSDRPPGTLTLVVAGGSSGTEAEAVQAELDRFMAANPGIRLTYLSTPSSATERHTLYVTWLSASTPTPDILNLDVVWPAEFAAADWILPVGEAAGSEPALPSMAPGMLEASRYRDRLVALPWYLDAGLLYYRTDVLARLGETPPRSTAELVRIARAGVRAGIRYGFLWQGSKYEGLAVNFFETVWGHGGEILGEDGSVRVDSPANRRALRFLRDLIARERASPRAVLTFTEEPTRQAFQQGDAVFMRNWPYAYRLMNAPGSPTAGKFEVMPLVGVDGPGAAALGGGVLAINRHTRHPKEAWRVVEFLVSREALKRFSLKTGYAPADLSLYDDPEFRAASPMLARMKEAFLRARSRPVSPAYPALSEIIQIHVSRALTGQEEVGEALAAAQREIEALLRKHQAEGARAGAG